MKNIIYGLRDPRNGEIFYVGQSAVGMSRPESHFYLAVRDYDNTPKADRIREITVSGHKHGIVVLQRLSSLKDLNAAEKYWITLGRTALGERFTNISNGSKQRKKPPAVKRLIAMSHEQYAWLDAGANKSSISVSEFFRRVLDDEMQKRGSTGK